MLQQKFCFYAIPCHCYKCVQLCTLVQMVCISRRNTFLIAFSTFCHPASRAPWMLLPVLGFQLVTFLFSFVLLVALFCMLLYAPYWVTSSRILCALQLLRCCCSSQNCRMEQWESYCLPGRTHLSKFFRMRKGFNDHSVTHQPLIVLSLFIMNIAEVVDYENAIIFEVHYMWKNKNIVKTVKFCFQVIWANLCCNYW